MPSQTCEIKREPEYRGPPSVAAKIAGGVWIEPATMERVLGASAWMLWKRWIHVRDQNGVSHASNAYFLSELALSTHQLKRAVSKLRKLGLVKDFGRRSRPGAPGPRLVRGIYTQKKVFVPVDAWRAMEQCSLNGGPRRAGQSKRFQIGDYLQRKEARMARKRPSKKVSRSHPGDKQIAPPKSSEKLLSFSKEKDARQARASGGVSLNKKSSKRRDKISEASWKAVATPESKEAVAGLARVLQVSRSVAPTKVFRPTNGYDFEGRTIVPPMPHSGVVPAAKSPEPPSVPKHASPANRVEFLRNTYRGFILSNYDKIHGSVWRPVEPGSSIWKKLLKAAAMLAEQGIPPAAWCMFAANLWEESGGKGNNRPPPFAWIWNASMIHKYRGWYGKEAGGMLRKKAVHPTRLKQLLRRWEDMRRAISSAGGWSCAPEQMEAIVSAYFPKSWEAAYETARSDAAALQIDLEIQAREGRWLW